MHDVARSLRLISLSSGVLVAAACAGDAPLNTAGRGLTVEVSALTLSGVGVACYDLAVTTATQTVWARGNPQRTALGAALHGGTAGAPDAGALCSDRYGNGSGADLSFVGTCDASLEADTVPGGVIQNDVTLWIDGLYDLAPGTPGAVDLADWRDPCPNGCRLQVDCLENRDTLVAFDLTLMRSAEQGFFDVAVSFGDVFCSAKLDSCYPDRDGDERDEPMLLLFGDDTTRDWTAVLGLACTAGPDASATRLAYGPMRVTCGAEVFLIDPGAGPGNAAVTSTPSGATLHYAVYRGAEALACDSGSCHKLYWNLAFDLADLAALGACDLTVEATAFDAAEPFVAGLPPRIDAVRPYVRIDAGLTRADGPYCQRNALDDGSGVVASVYRGGVVGMTAALAMCHELAVSTVTPTGASGCGVVDVVASAWANWDGSHTAPTALPYQGYEHDSLLVAPDRVLWASNYLTTWGDAGGLRLYAIDRVTDTISLVTETSVSTLLAGDPDWTYIEADWYHDGNLFARADGSVDLFFYGRRGDGTTTTDGLMIFHLDVGETSISLARAPTFIPIESFETPLLTGALSQVTFGRSFAVALSDGRYLYTHEVGAEGDYQGNNIWFGSPLPVEVTLHGSATVVDNQLVLANPTGGERGVLVWAVPASATQSFNAYATFANAWHSVVVDRQPGPTVVEPLPFPPSYVNATNVGYEFLPGASETLYLKVFAPDTLDASVTLDSMGWNWNRADHLVARVIDVTSPGTVTLGEPLRIPANTTSGLYLDINSHRLEVLPGGRVVIHVGNDSPLNGVTNIISRIIDTNTTPFGLSPWTTLVPPAFGPDWPFPSALNTDTFAEGVIGSVNYDSGEDEPFYASYAIGPTSLTAMDVQTLAPPLASAEYRNGVRYLGGNAYLYAVRMDGTYVYDPDTGTESYPGREHRYFVLTTDGAGQVLDVVGPFVTEGSGRSPLIEPLDEDHIFVAWRDYDPTTGDQRIATQLLVLNP